MQATLSRLNRWRERARHRRDHDSGEVHEYDPRVFGLLYEG
jgi:hypothetical protein